MRRVALAKLIHDLPVNWESSAAIPDIPVSAIRYDSRRVEEGDLFVAVSGGSADGHDYITAAISNGAIGVVGTKELAGLPVPCVRVDNSREALAHLAASFYDHPARKLTVIGVTGTDGKTTTTNLIFEIFKAAQIKAGLISTVNAVIGNEVVDTGFHVTTPEAVEVQGYLAKMVEAGLSTVVLETTSHGLAQHRVTACEYDIAVVTNITHEHLDYHGSYEGYRAAKGRMFTSLEQTVEKPFGNPRLAVLNRDDISYEYLSELVDVRQVSYGLKNPVDYCAKDIKSTPTGVDFRIIGDGIEEPAHCNLPGRFNVSNCLAAFAAARGLGVDARTAVQGLSDFHGVPGRMESINLGQPFSAIVDFAHTPNALKVAIETAREMTGQRVIAVFGSAGLRDRQKRRLMAEVSVRLADLTILTAEDPRTESLEDILAEMADAAVAAGGIEGKTFYRVADRGDAIRLGVKLAAAGDLVMSCGKGHEQSMCFGTVEYPWDDRTAMRAALAELLGMTGQEMPRLPTS
ncbi:MAG TPA: UDP-N-acetylmuramoyl-L-alanyl-D-glutamate--2,6-diaminopimelate ligase [Anaerolineaceae bacterium]|nr:UDP-N-acetylmuramoyl-L-alanyl-D-glutamate--2,6-diaminopimelate ligase [Anaerolineaceae bacterium]